MARSTHGSSPVRGHRPGPLCTAPGAWLVLACTVCLALVRPARAQPQPHFNTEVSVDTVLIGERFTVSIVAEHDGNVDISFPGADAGPVVFGELEVLGRSSVHKRSAGEALYIDSVAYRVATFELDSVRIPSIPVQVVADGDTTVASTPSGRAKVLSVVGPDAKGIHGVAPPLPFPRPIWAWVVLGLATLGLLGGLGYLWWRRQQRTESQKRKARPEIDQTPYEAATSWIRQLESYDLSDPSAVKPFYVELSSAVRVYLARDLGVAALERTTRELVETLQNRPDVPEEATTRVRAVLELADLVKFADIHPTSDDHDKVIREARAALDAIEAAPHSSPSEAVDSVAAAAEASD